MKPYSSFTYSTGYGKYANDYSQYGSIFRQENPYKMNAPTLTDRHVNALAGAQMDAYSAWKTHLEPPVNRSLFDRTIDTLVTTNYMVAGFADGAIKNMQGKSPWYQPWKQAGQGFMAGVGGVLGDGNEKHEYTFSRVIGTLGWNPESTAGKIVKGTLGFAGDIFLDPATYMTFGVSAALKGTGKVGQAAKALDDLVKRVPDAEVAVRTARLIEKGTDPTRAAAEARRAVQKNLDRYTNVTKMDETMARTMIQAENLMSGTKMSGKELARSSKRFADEFNKAIGLRAYNRDISIGVRNLPFVGNKIGDKLGKAGNTVKLVDGNTLRAWSDKVGVAKKYSDVRFAVYGSALAKHLSTSAPKVDWALKDPAQLYRLVAGAEKLIGKDIDKIARQKEINDIAKAMDMSPSEQREVIRFLENSANRQKVKTILRVGETEMAKLYKSMASTFTPDGKLYDELSQTYKSVKEIEAQMNSTARQLDELKKSRDDMQDARNTLSGDLEVLQKKFTQKHKRYVSSLARLDLKKVTDTEELSGIVKQLDEEIARLTSAKTENSAELVKLRKDAKEKINLTDTQRVQNVLKVEKETREEQARLRTEIRSAQKAGESDEAFKARIDAAKARREEIVQNLRILRTAEGETTQFKWNPNGENMEYTNSIKREVEAFKKIPDAPKKEQADIFAESAETASARIHSETDLKSFNRQKITQLVSEFIFGRKGMVAEMTDENMDALVKLIDEGHTPAYISTLPISRNRAYMTPRAKEMYSLIGNKIGYKSYDKQFRQKLKGLEKKRHFNALARKSQLLEPDDMQEFLRLKAIDEQRTDLINQYSKLSDEEFFRVVNAEKRAMAQKDLEDMFNGADGAWGGMGKAEDFGKGLINPDVFYDDVMREMREMAGNLKPHQQEPFFRRVVDNLGEAPVRIPARMKKTEDEVADMSDKMRAGGRAFDPEADRIQKPPTLMQSVYRQLQTTHGGRRYDDLTAAEQKLLIRSVLQESVEPGGKKLFNKARAAEAKKRADLNAASTKIETIRDSVYEGFVVHAGKETGTVLARQDTEVDTIFDVLMGDGRIAKLTPEDITGISRHKVFEPKDVINAPAVKEMLGSKKALLAELKQLNKTLQNPKRTVTPDTARINELVDMMRKNRKGMDERIHMENLKLRKPTEKALDAQKALPAAKEADKNIRKTLAKLNRERSAKDEQLQIAMMRASDEHTKKVAGVEKRFRAKEMLHNKQVPEMQKLIDSYEQTLKYHEQDILDYTKDMQMFRDTLDSMGAATVKQELDEVAARLIKLESSLNDMDVLEDFLRVQIEAKGGNFERWSRNVIDEESGLNALLKTIDNSSLTDKQKEWAKLVRTAFFRAGVDEVRIGKLTPEQFESRASTYVFHDATPEYQAFLAKEELAGRHSTPTQDYGFGTKWSGSSKQRTQQKDIHDFNIEMSKALNGSKAFNDNLGEIFVARMLKHEELMYDDKIGNTFMERFGQRWKAGDTLRAGFAHAANFSKVREFLVEQARQSMKNELRATARSRKGKGRVPRAELKAMFERHLAEVLPRYGFDDFAIMEGKTLPMLELTPKQLSMLTPTGTVYQMSEALISKANASRKIKMAKDESKMLQIYDKFLHFIKLHQTALMPAFHIKNKYSNTFQNYLGVGADAFDPRMQLNATKTMLARGDAEKLKDMKPLVSRDGTKVYHWNDIYEKAVAWGVIDEGFFAQDLSKMTESKGLLGKHVSGKYDPTSTAEFIPYKFATKVGTNVEGSDRLIHFASMLRQGKSIDEAADSAVKYLFDYSDLTPFERTWMKRIFPYYTWIRKNSRLQLGELIEQPETYMRMAKIHNGIEGMNNEDDMIDRRTLPNFAQDWIQTPFTTTNDAGQEVPLMLSPNMPYMDLGRLPDIFNPVQSAREWFGMTSPIGKVPLELAANYNSFFNSNIVETNAENPEDNTKHPGLARLRHVAKQLGWWNVGENIVTSEGSTKALHILNTLSGVKLMNHNEIYARQMLMKGLYEGNSDLGRAVSGYTEEIRTRMLNTVYLYQGTVSELVQDGVVRLTGAPPLKPGDYTGALAPISRETYDALSQEEKQKYAPPSKEEYTVYAQEAKRLSEEAYAETGKVKKFVWSLFEATDQVEDKEVLRIDHVADGDTFSVKRGDNTFNIRMLMVDTPETVDPDMNEKMPYGQEASDFTKAMLMGKDVTLTFQGKDAYGRSLAYVEVDGNDFNRMLIEEGLGKIRYIDGTKDAGRLRDYKAAERKAYQDETGLWSIEGYARPGEDEGYNLAE